MGDIADMVLEGLLCEVCGVLLDGNPPVYPRKCERCKTEEQSQNKSKKHRQRKNNRSKPQD